MLDKNIIRERIVESTIRLEEDLNSPYLTMAQALWIVSRQASQNQKLYDEIELQHKKIENKPTEIDETLQEALKTKVIGTPSQISIYAHLAQIVEYTIETGQNSSLIHLILSRADRKFIKFWERVLTNTSLSAFDFLEGININSRYEIGNRMAFITILYIFDIEDGRLDLDEIFDEIGDVTPHMLPGKMNAFSYFSSYTGTEFTLEDGYYTIDYMAFLFNGKNVPEIMRYLPWSTTIEEELLFDANSDEESIHYGSIPEELGLDVEALAIAEPIPAELMELACDRNFKQYINGLMRQLEECGAPIDHFMDGLDGLKINEESIEIKLKHADGSSLTITNIVAPLYFRYAIPLTQLTYSYTILSGKYLDICKAYERITNSEKKEDTSRQEIIVEDTKTKEKLKEAEKRIKELEKQLHEKEKENRRLSATIDEIQETTETKIKEMSGKTEERLRDVIKLKDEEIKLLRNSHREPTSLLASPGGELYPDEYQEQIRAILSDYIKYHEEETRKSDIARKILEANPSSGIIKAKKKLIENTLRGYKILDASQKAALEQAGLKLIRQDGSHYIFQLYDDPKYMVTLSKTASDNRTSLNTIKTINKNLF